MRSDTRRAWPWILAYWACIAFIGLLQDFYFHEGPLRPGQLVRYVLGNTTSVGVWIATWLVIVRVVRSMPSIDARRVLGLVALAIVLAACNQGAHDLLGCAFYECFSPQQRRELLLMSIPNTIAVVTSLFAVAWLLRAIALSREHHARLELARAELYRSQSRVLERQLRPHFLFNALQSIATLMHRDGRGAREMLLGLRALLAHSVQSGTVSEIRLADELEHIRQYLAIETWRFDNRLEVRFSVDERCRAALVPPFLLQPIVENAVQHAIGVRGEGRIEVHAAVDADTSRLEITVADSGPGETVAPAPARRPREGGIGLQNARTRLRVLYGAEWDLRFGRAGAGGLAVTVSLPFRAA